MGTPASRDAKKDYEKQNRLMKYLKRYEKQQQDHKSREEASPSLRKKNAKRLSELVGNLGIEDFTFRQEREQRQTSDGGEENDSRERGHRRDVNRRWR